MHEKKIDDLGMKQFSRQFAADLPMVSFSSWEWCQSLLAAEKYSVGPKLVMLFFGARLSSEPIAVLINVVGNLFGHMVLCLIT